MQRAKYVDNGRRQHMASSASDESQILMSDFEKQPNLKIARNRWVETEAGSSRYCFLTRIVGYMENDSRQHMASGYQRTWRRATSAKVGRRNN
jgi:hypothetical protein